MASWLPNLSAAILAIAMVTELCRLHLWFIYPYPSVLWCDEGYIAAFALRMLGGHWLPYVDAVSQRGPVLYWSRLSSSGSVGPLAGLGFDG